MLNCFQPRWQMSYFIGQNLKLWHQSFFAYFHFNYFLALYETQEIQYVDLCVVADNADAINVSVIKESWSFLPYSSNGSSSKRFSVISPRKFFWRGKGCEAEWRSYFSSLLFYRRLRFQGYYRQCIFNACFNLYTSRVWNSFYFIPFVSHLIWTGHFISGEINLARTDFLHCSPRQKTLSPILCP